MSEIFIITCDEGNKYGMLNMDDVARGCCGWIGRATKRLNDKQVDDFHWIIKFSKDMRTKKHVCPGCQEKEKLNDC